MILLALASLASAEVPTWTWVDGQVRRYLVEVHVQSPYVLYLLAERNHEVRVAEVALSATISCRRLQVVRSGSELSCAIDDAGIRAIPLVTDRGRAGSVLAEYEQILESGTIEARQTPDGRLRDIRLDDVVRDNDRQSYIHDVALSFLQRALAPLDLPLPEEGVVVGDSWKHKDPLAAATPFALTSIGSARFEQTWTATEEGHLHLAGAGNGMVAVGQDRWDLGYESVARFADLDGGLVLSHFRVVGQATPGSPITSGGEPMPYLLESRIEEVPLDATVEIPASAEI